jgi:hypothetical protein
MRYKVVLSIVSRVFPERLLKFLNKHWRVGYDPSDGWSFWMNASYARYVRKDMKSSHGPHGDTEYDWPYEDILP